MVGSNAQAKFDAIRNEVGGTAAVVPTEMEVHPKSFAVEFDDWAKQEMMTHGEKVSFKEWAKKKVKNMETWI